MNGYANTDQVAGGLSMRLHARAFVFAMPGNTRRVAFVTADIAHVYHSIRLGVLKQLSARLGATFSERNVMIAATHTHASPGGLSHHVLYNAVTFGFIPQNYQAVVDGITEAIIQANNAVGPAKLSFARGDIYAPASVNRSMVAYVQNPEALAGAGAVPPVDPRMSVLRVDRPTGPAGVIAWFPVHNTSLPRDNLIVSPDHKGYAAYLFERQQGSIPPFKRPGAFVAAFPNGAEGDLSPNLGPNITPPGADPATPQALRPNLPVPSTGFNSMVHIGTKQFNSAAILWAAPWAEAVSGTVDYRHRFVRLPGFQVTGTTHRNGIGGTTLCNGAMGFSFAAGAEDGPSGVSLFREGMTRNTAGILAAFNLMATNQLGAWYGVILGRLPLSDALPMSDPCQGEKPVLIPTTSLGLTPEILPFQLFRVGPVAIVGLPFELTTVAGRRVEQAVLARLAPAGVTRVVLTGLANDYSGYVTTFEEYQTQQYEGASTMFGPLQLEACIQILSEMADAMRTGQPVADAGPTPPDLSAGQIQLQTGVITDVLPVGEQFGQVLLQPLAQINRGGAMTVQFRAGHPKNDLRRNSSHALVEQRMADGGWQPVAWDAMPELVVRWRREDDLIAAARAEVVWAVPRDATPGIYRIRYFGRSKNPLGTLADFVGVTNAFEVR